MYALSIRLRPWVFSANVMMAQIKFVVRTLFGCSLLSRMTVFLVCPSSFFCIFTHPSSLQDGDGWTALIGAAYHGYDKTIPLLLEAGAQIDAQNNGGMTPLIWAIYWGKEAAVRELLKGNPNLDLKSNSGKTALDWARGNNHQSIVDLLVNHGRP